MGTGVAAGENRAVEAANKAISSPLLIDTSIDGAKGVLINITGGKDLTLHEVGKASQLIHKMAHPEANIIFGTVIDAAMKDLVKVTVIATGFDREYQKEKEAPQAKAAAGVPAVPPSLRRRTPPAIPAPGPAAGPIFRETPPYPFEREDRPRLETGPNESPAGWDRMWDAFETPSFIRNKHTQLRKN